MFHLPNKPKVVEEKENWARFEIEALYPGYGVTIGNSMRRVLLSSLGGAAVTQVKIKGVQHEFSTINGVLEDVILIMMNLKQMRFKIFTDEPQRAVLKIKGEKKVAGSDFEFPTQLELINKNCPIATLTDKKSELEMEIQVEKGLGYVSVESRKKLGKMEIGSLGVDAIFTPVKRVNFKVENMRVGDRTDFDRLYLDVETDGTITPKDAFNEATEILINHFSLISQAFLKPAPEIKEEKKEAKEEKEGDDKLKTKVEDLNLSTRTMNALLEGNVRTVGGLARKSEQSLLELEGIGDKGIKEIRKSLKKFGLELKTEEK